MKKSNFEQWEEICKEFCKQKGYKLLFVNNTDFGYMDNEEGLHHVYADELALMLGGLN